MLRSELIELLVQRFPEIPRHDVEAAAKLIFSEINNALASGHRVELRDFGVFKTNTLKAMTGRNPSTGEAVQLNVRKSMRFKAGAQLRRRLNEKPKAEIRLPLLDDSCEPAVKMRVTPDERLHIL